MGVRERERGTLGTCLEQPARASLMGADTSPAKPNLPATLGLGTELAADLPRHFHDRIRLFQNLFAIKITRAYRLAAAAGGPAWRASTVVRIVSCLETRALWLVLQLASLGFRAARAGKTRPRIRPQHKSPGAERWPTGRDAWLLVS